MTATSAGPEELHQLRLQVNGAVHEVVVPARRLLSDALRNECGLTGTHVGCEHGVCGACTVLVDGRPVRSCLMLAVGAQDCEITTVEGLAGPDDALSPVQQAFSDCHGLQCGFCTPGFLTTITAGLRDNPSPTREQAREMVGGNLCRCTGYHNIVDAVLRAAEIGGADSGEGDGFVTGAERLPQPSDDEAVDPPDGEEPLGATPSQAPEEELGGGGA